MVVNPLEKQIANTRLTTQRETSAVFIEYFATIIDNQHTICNDMFHGFDASKYARPQFIMDFLWIDCLVCIYGNIGVN